MARCAVPTTFLSGVTASGCVRHELSHPPVMGGGASRTAVTRASWRCTMPPRPALDGFGREPAADGAEPFDRRFERVAGLGRDDGDQAAGEDDLTGV